MLTRKHHQHHDNECDEYGVIYDNFETTAAVVDDTVAVAFNQSFSRCCCCKQLN